MKPSDLARRRTSHVVVFGEPKSGKSTIVSKLLEDGFNLTWISMDNGHEVIFKLPLSPEILDQRLNIVIIPDTKEFPVAISTCREIMKNRPTKICDRHGRVNCMVCAKDENALHTIIDTSKFTGKDVLVFDHLGQLSASAITSAYIKYKKDLEEKPEWEQYGMQGILLDGFFTNVQQAPFNIVCITHIEESRSEDGTKKLYPLAGTTNFSRGMGKYFDHMIYCEVVNGSHKFGSGTGYQARVLTGSRTDIFIEKQKVPSLAPFFTQPIQDAPGTMTGKDIKVVLETLLPTLPQTNTETSTSSKPPSLEGDINSKPTQPSILVPNLSVGVAEIETTSTVIATPIPVSPVASVSTSDSNFREALLAKLRAKKQGQG